MYCKSFYSKILSCKHEFFGEYCLISNTVFIVFHQNIKSYYNCFYDYFRFFPIKPFTLSRGHNYHNQIMTISRTLRLFSET